jgi:elongation factor G
VLDAKSVLLNTTQDSAKERVAKVLQMYADDYEEIPCLEAGNIACLQGLRFTKTGDTLVSQPRTAKRGNMENIQLLPINIPPPVFFCSIEAASLSEEKKFEEGLHALIREDPSLSLSIDPDTRQTLLGGMGELHLEISIGRLREVHRVDASVGKVVIGYRETLNLEEGLNHEETFVLDRDVFGKKSWASASVRISLIQDIYALEEGARAISADSDGNIVEVEESVASQPAMKGMPLFDIKQSLVNGVKSALSRGPFLGFPITNIRVDVVGLECRAEVTNASAIRVAAYRATVAAISNAALRTPEAPAFGTKGALLEPIMNVDIRIPQRFVGTVTRDLGGVRRGQILSLDGQEGEEEQSEYDSQIVRARMPLSSLMGYSTSLRGLTQGTGSFTMELSGFGVVNSDTVKQVIKQF